MTELSPAVCALKAELGRAIRRDHHRRLRRRKTIRTAAVGMGAVLALSGGAVATGEALGVIDLGGGVTVVRVSKIPLSGDRIGVCYSGHCPMGPRAPYVYDLTDKHLRAFGSIGWSVCGHKRIPFAPRQVYLASIRPLTAKELREAANALSGIRRRRAMLPRGTGLVMGLAATRLCR